MTTWTTEAVAELRALYPTKNAAELAAHFTCTVRAIRTKCWKLGLNAKAPPWTDEEEQLLRAAYASTTEPVRLAELAKALGRHRTNVSRKARELGLTSYHRKRAYDAEALSRRSHEFIAKHGHPRGALGHRHSVETRAKLSAASLAMWADPGAKLRAPEMTERRAAHASARARQAIAEGRWKPYSRARGGTRADLGMYFRSAWEANYARILSARVERGEIASWTYEAKTFALAGGGGVRSYTPDFLVVALDGSHEWHEVKGWLDPKSQTRLARMAAQYPTEPTRLIGEEFFVAFVREGRAASIHGWEF